VDKNCKANKFAVPASLSPKPPDIIRSPETLLFRMIAAWMLVAVSALRPLDNPAATVFLGKLVRAGFGFLMTVLVARLLGPGDFGLFYLAITIIVIGQTVIGDGLDPGIVRYYAAVASDDLGAARDVLRSAFALRIFIALPIALVAWPFGEWISAEVFKAPEYALPIQVGILGSAAAAMWNFGLVVYQSQERFAILALLTPSVNVFRVFTTLILIAVGHLTLASILGLHISIFFVGAALIVMKSRRLLLPFVVKPTFLRTLLAFSGWAALSNLCFLLQANLGIPVLTYFRNSEAAGTFAAGASLLMIIDQLTSSILITKLPIVSRMKTVAEYRDYIRKSLTTYGALALLLTPTILLAEDIIVILYGAEFQSSAEIFQILLLGFLVTLVTHPLYIIFYAIERPQAAALAAVGGLAGWLLAAGALIPSFGADGAAWATLASRIIHGLLIVVAIFYVLKNCTAKA
jgi:O-antigen/teichoic acid export membrane protein